MAQNTAAAAQNTNLSLATGTNILFRGLLQATGNPGATMPTLRFQKNGSGGYAVVPDSATTVYPIPTFIRAGTMASGTGAVTVTLPVHSIGDLLLFLVETANQAVATAPTSPFVELSASPQGTGTAAGTAATRLTAYACIANGSEAASYNIGDAGDHTAGVCLVFSGTHQTLATALHQVAGSVASSASTSVSFDSVTTTVNNCLIVNIIANATDTTTAQLSGSANASLSSVTEQFDQNVTAGNGGGISVVTGGLATAGASGSTTGTLATSSVQGKITIALRAPADVTNEIYMSDSSNITNGEATTQRMSGGSGSFDAGKIWDTANGGSVTIGNNDNTEVEYCIKLAASLSNGDYFDLRVYNGAGALDSYSNTGRLTVSSSSDVTVALTGQAATASAGTLATSRTIAQSGQAATAASGTLGVGISTSLSGSAVTASAGTLAPGMSIALTGSAPQALAGTLAPSLSLSLAGTAANASAGTITVDIGGNVTVALSGQAVTVSAGTLDQSRSVALSGTNATASAGTLQAGIFKALSGSSSAVSAGTIGVAISTALSGSAVAASAGTITASATGNVTVALTGIETMVLAGTLTVTNSGGGMPNVVGLNFDMALKVLQDAGIYVPLAVFAFQPSTITVRWVSGGTPGLISAQSVPAGAIANPGDAITLSVNQFPFGAVIDMPPDWSQR